MTDAEYIRQESRLAQSDGLLDASRILMLIAHNLDQYDKDREAMIVFAKNVFSLHFDMRRLWVVTLNGFAADGKRCECCAATPMEAIRQAVAHVAGEDK